MDLLKIVSRRSIIPSLFLISPMVIEAKKKDKNKKSKKKDKKVRPYSPPPAPRQPVNLNGSGPMITPYFSLRIGLYAVNSTVTATSSTGGLFFADLYNQAGLVDIVIVENPEYAGTFSYQDLTEVDADGSYFFHVEEAEGPWTISLLPY